MSKVLQGPVVTLRGEGRGDAGSEHPRATGLRALLPSPLLLWGALLACES